MVLNSKGKNKSKNDFKKVLISTFLLSLLIVLFDIYIQLNSMNSIAQKCSYLDPWIIDFLAFFASIFLIVEGFEKKISRRNWGALFINVVLNYILIPYLGIIGASIATFMSVFIAHYIFDFFDSELKPLLSIKNDALLRMIGK